MSQTPQRPDESDELDRIASLATQKSYDERLEMERESSTPQSSATSTASDDGEDDLDRLAKLALQEQDKPGPFAKENADYFRSQATPPKAPPATKPDVSEVALAGDRPQARKPRSSTSAPAGLNLSSATPAPYAPPVITPPGAPTRAAGMSVAAAMGIHDENSLQARVANALGDAAAHPVKTAVGIVWMPVEAANTLAVAALELEERDQVAMAGGDPNSVPRTVSPKDAAIAAAQLATLPLGPEVGKILGGLAAPFIGSRAAAIGASAAVGAGAGAIYSPDDPAVGAVIGGAAGAAHAGASGARARGLRITNRVDANLAQTPDRLITDNRPSRRGSSTATARPMPPDAPIAPEPAPYTVEQNTVPEALYRHAQIPEVREGMLAKLHEALNKKPEAPPAAPAPSATAATAATKPKAAGAPRAYVPSSEALHRTLTPEETQIRETAINLKHADPAAIATAAPEMAARIPENAILVPIPDHTGSARANIKLAEAIAKLHPTAAVSVSLGRSTKVESSRVRRQTGKPGLTADEHEQSLARTLEVPKDRPIVLIDNVETTGATAEGARRVLGRSDAQLVTYAKAPIPHTEAAAAEPKKSLIETVREAVKTAQGSIGDAIAPHNAEERRRLNQEAHTDAMTGIGNQRAYEKAIVRAEADPNTSVVRFDLNGFKNVNDAAGHDAGDAALKDVAQAMQKHVPPGRAVFRVGGDEFAAIVPKADAQRIRDAIEKEIGVRDVDGKAKYSISGGIGATNAEADASAIARKAEHKKAQGMAGRAETPAKGKIGDVRMEPLENIDVEPERFQYKLNTNEHGVTNALEGVKWNDDLAGVVTLWRDHTTDNRLKVINGHHRDRLARQSGRTHLAVREIEAATAHEARARGALINIADGKGTSVDAAKLFRDTKLSPADMAAYGVNPKGTIAREGMALSELHPTLFAKVVNGEIPSARGAVIGGAGLAHEQQLALANMLETREASGKRLTNEAISELIRFVKEAGTETTTQDSLFGIESLTASLAPEKAELSAYVKDRLSKDRRLFSFLTKGGRASRIEDAGVGKIDTKGAGDLASRSAQTEEVYNKLSTMSGPVAAALNQAAREWVQGGSKNEIRNALYESVAEAVRAVVGGGEAPRVDGLPEGREGPEAAAGSPRSAAPDDGEVSPPAFNDPDQVGLLGDRGAPRGSRGRGGKHADRAPEPTSIDSSRRVVWNGPYNEALAKLPDAQLAFMHEELERRYDASIPGTRENEVLHRDLLDTRNEVQGRERAKKKGGADDVASRARTEVGKAGMGVNRQNLADSMSANVYGAGLAQVIVKEAIQNAIDAIRPMGKGKIHVYIDENTTDYGLHGKDTGGPHIRIEDSGTGMTPDVAVGAFLDAFESHKAEGSSGALGIAKAALFRYADPFSMHTVAEVPGRGKVKTVVKGSGQDWVDGNLDVHEEDVPDDTPTGSVYEVRIDRSKIKDSQLGWDSARAFLRELQENSRIPNLEITASQGLEELPSVVPQEIRKQLTVPGARVKVFIGDKPSKTAFGNHTYVKVLNNGYFQFTTMMKFAPNAPDIWVDLSPSVGVSSPEYPFTIDRSKLKHETQRAIEAGLEDLADNAERSEIDAMVRALANAPRVDGYKSARVFAADPGITPELAQKIAGRGYIAGFAEALAEAGSEIMAALEQPFKLASAEMGGISLGHSELGINIMRSALFDRAKKLGVTIGGDARNLVLINPYSIMVESRTLRAIHAWDPEHLSDIMWGTMVHELAHQLARGHDEKFAGVLSRIESRAARIQHKHIAKLDAIWQSVLGDQTFEEDLAEIRTAWTNDRNNPFKRYSGHGGNLEFIDVGSPNKAVPRDAVGSDRGGRDVHASSRSRVGGGESGLPGDDDLQRRGPGSGDDASAGSAELRGADGRRRGLDRAEGVDAEARGGDRAAGDRDDAAGGRGGIDQRDRAAAGEGAAGAGDLRRRAGTAGEAGSVREELPGADARQLTASELYQLEKEKRGLKIAKRQERPKAAAVEEALPVTAPDEPDTDVDDVDDAKALPLAPDHFSPPVRRVRLQGTTVVDEHGEPMVVYYHTASATDDPTFEPKRVDYNAPWMRRKPRVSQTPEQLGWTADKARALMLEHGPWSAEELARQEKALTIAKHGARPIHGLPALKKIIERMGGGQQGPWKSRWYPSSWWKRFEGLADAPAGLDRPIGIHLHGFEQVVDARDFGGPIRKHAVYANIRNPLRLPDGGAPPWTYEAVRAAMLQSGHWSEAAIAKYEKSAAVQQRYRPALVGVDALRGLMKKSLPGLGRIDGIVYRNLDAAPGLAPLQLSEDSALKDWIASGSETDSPEHQHYLETRDRRRRWQDKHAHDSWLAFDDAQVEPAKMLVEKEPAGAPQSLHSPRGSDSKYMDRPREKKAPLPEIPREPATNTPLVNRFLEPTESKPASDRVRERDLFGNEAEPSIDDQQSMFGEKAGTEASRSLEGTERVARQEIDKLRLEANNAAPVARAKILRRIAELEKLVNRGKAISADEMATRAGAGENEDIFGAEESEKRTGIPAAKRVREATDEMEWVIYDDAGADGAMQIRARGLSTYGEALALRDKEFKGGDIEYLQTKKLDRSEKVGMPRGRNGGRPTNAAIEQELADELTSRGIEHKFNYIGTEPYIPNQKARTANAKRAIAKQKDDAGLFAEQTKFETAEERVARLNANNVAFTARMAKAERTGWQRALAALDELEPADRAAAIKEWNAKRYPRSPEYFNDFLRTRARENPSGDTTLYGFADPFTAAAYAFYKAVKNHRANKLGTSPHPMPEPAGLGQHRSQIRPFDLAEKIKTLFNPESLGPEAKGTAGNIRHIAADRFMRRQQAEHALRALEKYLDKQPRGKQIDYWDAYEQGVPTGDKFIDAMNTVFRDVTEQRTQLLVKLDRLRAQRAITDYIGRFWDVHNKGGKATNFLQSIFARRPFEGPKSFLKQRSHEFFVDGLEAGLKPATYNYVSSQLAKIAEMEKLIASELTLRAEQRAGRAKPVMTGMAPPRDAAGEPWVKIDRDGNDQAFTIWAPPVVQHWEGVDAVVYGKLRALLADLKVEHVRDVTIGGNRLGFAEGDKRITTKFGGPEGVIMHELGHILDARFGLRKAIEDGIGKPPRRVGKKGKSAGKSLPDYKNEHPDARKNRELLREELRQLANLRREYVVGNKGVVPPSDKLHPADRQYLHSWPEKMANMVEAFIAARPRFKKVAPGIFEIFDQVVKDNPELHPLRDIEPSMSRETHMTETRLPGPVKAGEWFAPRASAAVWANHLSRGLRGNPVYDAVTAPGAAATQIILGISGFHGTVIATEGAFSDMVMAADAARQGEGKKSVKALGRIIGSPVTSAVSAVAGSVAPKKAARLAGAAFGTKVLEEYRVPGSHPELSKVLEAMIAGGFRAQEKSEIWRGDRVEKMKQAMHDALYADTKLKRAWGKSRVPLDAVFAGIELLSSPLMSKYVPLMKMASTYHAVAQRLSELPPGISVDEFHAEMWDIVKEMDYRFGLVVYDNHFINNVIKHLAQAMFLAPGWTFGTATLMGRGVRDAAVAPKRLYDRARGKAKPGQAILGRSGKYWVAAVVGTMIINGLATYFNTGEMPGEDFADEGWKDFFAFRDGTFDADGNANRHTIPGYLMHDVWGWTHHPVKTVINKQNPFFAFVGRWLRNETFYGDMIYDPDDSPAQKARSIGTEAVKELAMPLSVQNYLEGRKRESVGAGEMLRNAMGVTPAKRELVRSPAQNRIAEIQSRRGKTVMTPEKAEARDERRDLLSGLRLGASDIDDRIRRVIERGEIGSRELHRLMKRAGMIPLAERFKTLTPEEALEVWDRARPDEKAIFGPLLVKKLRNAAKAKK